MLTTIKHEHNLQFSRLINFITYKAIALVNKMICKISVNAVIYSKLLKHVASSR